MQTNRLWFVALVTLFAVSARAQNTFPASGNVGIGTTTPASSLQIGSVNTFTNNNDLLLTYYGAGNNVKIDFTYANSSYLGGTGTAASRIMAVDNNYGADLYLQSKVQGADSNPMRTNMFVGASGNVGIGTTAPAYQLDVAGQIHSSSGGVVFPDGTTQTTAFIPANCGADYAESVEVTGDRTKYEPGDVLVIDPSAPGKFLKSNKRYSTLVAGIYSTQPGFVGRLHPKDAKTDETEVPMAMVGRVPTKVTVENGPIKVGDLLVASSTLGRAMKGTDRSLLTGAVIGKALGSLDTGTGVIEVLVTLQ